MKGTFLLALFIIFNVAAIAQAGLPGDALPQAGVKKNQLAWECKLLQTRYEFENDGTGHKEITARISIFNLSGAEQWRELSFQFQTPRERVEVIYVHVIKPNGEVLTIQPNETPRAGVMKHSEESRLGFGEQIVSLPLLSPGDSIEYAVRTILVIALTPGYFSLEYAFHHDYLAEEQLEINVPASRPVKLKIKSGIQTSITETKGRRIYRWRNFNSAPKEQAVIASADLIITDQLSNQSPDIEISNFESWSQVGFWYAESGRNGRTPSLTILGKADELTKGLTDDVAKVEALYDFVATKIDYFSLAPLGIGGYQARTADDVLYSGFGDCKDKDNLLAALLEAKGMHASSVLVNPFRNLDSDLPSPWAFSHVFTMVALAQNQIWMDASDGLIPFGMLSKELRNKKVLVIPADREPYLAITPDKISSHRSN